MAKVRTVGDALGPVEVFGDEPLDGIGTPVPVGTAPALPAPLPVVPVKLAAPRIVKETSRVGRELPAGAQRYRIRAKDGTKPASYIATPATYQQDAAEREYLRHHQIPKAADVRGLAVCALPD